MNTRTRAGTLVALVLAVAACAEEQDDPKAAPRVLPFDEDEHPLISQEERERLAIAVEQPDGTRQWVPLTEQYADDVEIYASDEALEAMRPVAEVELEPLHPAGADELVAELDPQAFCNCSYSFACNDPTGEVREVWICEPPVFYPFADAAPSVPSVDGYDLAADLQPSAGFDWHPWWCHVVYQPVFHPISCRNSCAACATQLCTNQATGATWVGEPPADAWCGNSIWVPCGPHSTCG